jgi:hypothetical protein
MQYFNGCITYKQASFMKAQDIPPNGSFPKTHIGIGKDRCIGSPADHTDRFGIVIINLLAVESEPGNNNDAFCRKMPDQLQNFVHRTACDKPGCQFSLLPVVKLNKIVDLH